MKKFIVYYKKEFQQKLKKEQDIIYGYSETDALLRAGIDRKMVERIFLTFI